VVEVAGEVEVVFKEHNEVQPMAKRRRKQKNKSSFLDSGFSRSVAKNVGIMAYGASRQAISNAINKLPIVNKFAGLEIVDEVAIFGVATIADKMMGRNKPLILKDFVKAAKTVEMARIGVFAFDQFRGMGGSGSNDLEI